MNQLEINVKNLIIRESLIKKGEKVIVAFSGGPDSITLLNILNNIKGSIGFELYAFHMNHMLRGIDAYKDAMFCANFCEKNSIPSFIKQIDINRLATRINKGIEETARIARYKMLYELKKTIYADKIAVAHNMEDQVETFFLNFFRGSGLNGLKGMSYISNGIIVRPLLNAKREEIEEYCRIENLNPVIDKTNLEHIYSRNKIRLDLVPYIKKNFSKNIVDITHRNTILLSEDSYYIENEANKIFNKLAKIEDKDKIVFNAEEIKKYPFAILSRLLRKSFSLLLGNTKEIEYVHILDSISLINNSEKNKELHLPRNILIYKRSNKILITNKEIKFEDLDYKYEIKVNEKKYINEIKATCFLKILPKEVCMNLPTGKNIKVFDYDKVHPPIFIRNRKDGDKIKPIGMDGTKKISDILINKKIDNKDKNNYPIIEDSRGILWLWDYRISEDYKIDEKTEKVLRISLKFD